MFEHHQDELNSESHHGFKHAKIEKIIIVTLIFKLKKYNANCLDNKIAKTPYVLVEGCKALLVVTYRRLL